MISTLVENGWISLLAMLVLAGELAAALLTRGGRAFVANAFSGLFLLAALHLALTGSGAVWIAAALTGALFTHLAYLVAARGTPARHAAARSGPVSGPSAPPDAQAQAGLGPGHGNCGNERVEPAGLPR